MKIRVFRGMDNAVYRVLVITEDWGQEDLKLMAQFGEPEVNVGGEVEYIIGSEPKLKTLGDIYVRLLHGFPFQMCFDTRDYSGSVEEAMAIGNEWKERVISDINNAVFNLRQKRIPLPTEEVVDNVGDSEMQGAQ